MIELWLVQEAGADDDLYDDQIISNAATVPVIGSTLDTARGTQLVLGLHYDFHTTDGTCRVHVRVKKTQRHW